MCALVTRAAAAPGIPPSESVLDQAARAAAIIGSRHPFGFFYNVPAAFRGATCPGGALYLYGSNKYVVPDAMRQQILDDKLVTKGWDGKLSSSRLIPSNGPSLWRLHAGTSMLPDELLEALPFSGRRAAVWDAAAQQLVCLTWSAEVAFNERGYPALPDVKAKGKQWYSMSKGEADHRTPLMLFDELSVTAMLLPALWRPDATNLYTLSRTERFYDPPAANGMRQLYYEVLASERTTNGARGGARGT